MKKVLLNIFLSIISISTFAQNIEFIAQAPSNVQIGKPFYIQYTLKASSKGKNFQYPKMENFSILNISTSQSSSSSISNINGKITTEKYIILSWYLTVEAKQTGKFKIKPATVKVADKIYKSNSTEINVSKGTTIKNTNKNEVENIKSTNTKDLFLNLTTEKTNVFIGEPIYLTCKMFSRYNVNIQDFTPPAFNNFWSKEIKTKGPVKAEQIILNNKSYLTATLDKKVIFPQKSGLLKLNSYEVTFQLYDSWGFPSGTRKVISNKKEITVKPLPAGKPESFSGAVGKFIISLKTDNDIVKVDEAFTLEISIKGNGNFGLFDFPEIALPKSFEELEPENKDNLNISNLGIDGTSKYKYSFIARVPGKYKIPQINFSYFDPEKAKYVTVKTDTMTIKVIGDSSKNSISGNQLQIEKSEVTELGNDIRYIKTGKVKFVKKNNYLFGKKIFWLSYLIPLVIFLFLIIILRKKIKENNDIKYVRYKKADKVSKKRLKKAEKYLRNNELDDFYSEISKTLWGYLSDKLAISLSELTRDNVIENLNRNSVDQELIDEFIEVIDLCEIARFSPSNDTSQSETIFNRAGQIISTFEKIS